MPSCLVKNFGPTINIDVDAVSNRTNRRVDVLRLSRMKAHCDGDRTTGYQGRRIGGAALARIGGARHMNKRIGYDCGWSLGMRLTIVANVPAKFNVTGSRS